MAERPHRYYFIEQAATGQVYERPTAYVNIPGHVRQIALPWRDTDILTAGNVGKYTCSCDFRTTGKAEP